MDVVTAVRAGLVTAITQCSYAVTAAASSRPTDYASLDARAQEALVRQGTLRVLLEYAREVGAVQSSGPLF